MLIARRAQPLGHHPARLTGRGQRQHLVTPAKREQRPRRQRAAHRAEVEKSPRVDRRLSRGYRREVLEALRRVPFGRTVTYGELAGRTGRPGASRAVGSAMATNPIPIVVPCHRVVRTGGALGGYGGGVDAKAWLLRHEGARLG